jgi:hypothetical protein
MEKKSKPTGYKKTILNEIRACRSFRNLVTEKKAQIIEVNNIINRKAI